MDPILPEVVLIGGGHSHVQLLRQHAMRPFPARLTVVVDRPVALYSGMVPGFVARQYAAHELSIDVRPLARRAGVRFVEGRVSRVDPAAKRVFVEGRAPLAYDYASLNIGATVAGLDVPGVREHAVATRPIRVLVDTIDARTAALGHEPSIVVVGAGAGGVELAFCIQERIRSRRPRISLVFASERPLPGRHARVGEAVVDAAHRRGIGLLPEQRVVRVEADRVELANGQVLPSDLTVWVAGAWPHDLARESGLPVDDRGYVRVRDTLQVHGHPTLFAVGDCAVPESWPDIPKAGVYAVREGPVLADNLRAALESRPLVPYAPQRDFFGILNLGDGIAIGAKWGIPVTGKAMFTWKDRIDRRFMERFQVLDARGAPAPAFARGMPAMPEMDAFCGGCAAKVGQTPLSRALARLDPPPPSPAVALGPAEADDVGAVRFGDALLVANLDAFTAFTDDPWLVGRVAAQNAMSDLYAKGVAPEHAMALVQIPRDLPDEETLFQVMSGIRSALDEDGVALLGGHTVLGDALLVGLSVTAHTQRVPWTIDGAREGDGIWLTRPLGTGVLFHADMAGGVPGEAMSDVLATMSASHRPVFEGLRDSRVHAATDVTGFGLAGHLLEILEASGLAASLDLDAVPVYPGVLDLLGRGERSTSHDENRRVIRAVAGTHPHLELLFDPQTAGGQLLCAPDALPGATRIGTLVAHDPSIARIRLESP